MKALRPAPADFRDHAETVGVRPLMDRYRASKVTVMRWFDETGIDRPTLSGGKPLRPIPDDFADLQHGRTNSFLRNHYNCGLDTITRWRKSLNLPAKPATPADFAERYAVMTIDQLRKHYGRGYNVICGWIKAAGIARVTSAQRRVSRRPAEPKPKPVLFERAAPAKRNPRAKLMAFHRPAPETIVRDMSEAGQAADFLRRFGPVYRCDVRGHPLADGFFWKRGNSLPLTDSELIERADWLRRKEAA